MHPVAHQVEVPLEQLERILLDHAREDFTGSVEIDVRITAGAVGFVELNAETHESQHFKTNAPAWGEIAANRPPRPAVDREALVRRIIHENEGKLRLVSTVRRVVGHFHAGELRELEWVLPK